MSTQSAVRSTFRRISGAGTKCPLVDPANKALVGVTIGMFDGLHRGHQALIGQLQASLQKKAQQREQSTGVPQVILPVMLSFYPHPRSVLKRSNMGEYFPFTALRTKISYAQAAGINLILAAHFTSQFAKLTPEQFVKAILVDALDAKLIVVGHDWAFGRDRSGSIDALRQLGDKYGVQVEVVPPVEIGGERVSSTWLRDLLEAGNVLRAQELLGRRYSLEGRVRRGDGRGQVLGFPTANLEFPRLFLPKNGVYAGWARCGTQFLPAVANLGVRPTFSGQGSERRKLEVHILGQQQGSPPISLLGQRIEFQFVDRIRDEHRFPNVEALRAQIHDDCKTATELLRSAR